MKFLRLLSLLVLCAGAARADLLDEASGLQRQWDSAIIDLYSGEWQAAGWTPLADSARTFAKHLRGETAKKLWLGDLPAAVSAPLDAAGWLGRRQSLLQHVCALEMLDRERAGELEPAREWRALIQLPKYADAVQGALALQRGKGAQKEAVAQLLAREYLVWQGTIIREKTDALHKLIQQERTSPELLAARTAQLEALAAYPESLLQLVKAPGAAGTAAWAATAQNEAAPALLARFEKWSASILGRLPNLLTEEEVTRRERLLIKLLKLIPMEYAAGVRDGQIVVPLEYREAESFTTQSRQILDELRVPWERARAEAFAQHGPALRTAIEQMEKAIAARVDHGEVEQEADRAMSILSDHFGISLRRQGKASEVIAETMLDIRTLLTSSLAAAREGRWSEAETARLEAYTTFDLEIESRAMPRDPPLALRVEKMFLDGSREQIGIKAALDARLSGEKLNAAYQAALDGLNECGALLQVSLSPVTAVYTTISVVTREGLEAVVILAALLAGLRGTENKRTRRNIGLGAGAAIVASALTFIVSRIFIQSLSRHGETLEAVVSVLAVVVLLIVTNWVFHKMYWVEWNSRLRTLTRSVNDGGQTASSNLAMIGVGFLTIYREGFETVLFLQSLLLEAGLRPVLIGLLIGGGIVAGAGVAVFMIGAKLPYRKLLVFTGVLVVTVLVTFLGSTVRLFQTVGWIPVHPIPWLELPAWMGIWFGFYPSWEGILIPWLGVVYVGGAWLFVKWQSRRNQAAILAEHSSELGPKNSRPQVAAREHEVVAH